MDKPFDTTHSFFLIRTHTILQYLAKSSKISLKYLPFIAFSFLFSLFMMPFNLIEDIRYAKCKKIKIKNPVFILGHWRTGTTILQYLLSRDTNTFGFITPIDFMSYNTSLISSLLSKNKKEETITNMRHYDNLKFKSDMPFEEYTTHTIRYSDASWSMHLFPNDKEKYFNYAFVDELSEKQQKLWFKHYDSILKRYTLKCNMHEKSFLSKSPDSIARAYYLKQKYPDAKFINIYRNPYATIRSTIHLFELVFKRFCLQDTPNHNEIVDFAIYTFKRMYTKYFSDLEKIPQDSIYEIKFEDFEKNPIPILKSVYEKFGWDFEAAEKPMSDYWATMSTYQKNNYDYPPELIKKINTELGFYFEHYGYPKLEV